MRGSLLFLVILLTGCSPDEAGPVGAEADASEATDGGTLDADAGPRPELAECVLTAECAEGLECWGDDADFLAPSRCFRMVESCVGDPCGPGFYCRHFGTEEENGAEVDRYRCVKRAAIGEACAYHDDREVNTCADGARCDAAAWPQRTCVAATPAPAGKAEGELCGRFDECAAGLFCGTDGVAVRCQKRGVEGATCFAQESACAIGLECQHTGGGCSSWLDCASQMGDSNYSCCATESGGGQCRPNAMANGCAEPTGTCAVETFF